MYRRASVFSKLRFDFRIRAAAIAVRANITVQEPVAVRYILIRSIMVSFEFDLRGDFSAQARDVDRQGEILIDAAFEQAEYILLVVKPRENVNLSPALVVASYPCGDVVSAQQGPDRKRQDEVALRELRDHTVIPPCEGRHIGVE